MVKAKTVLPEVTLLYDARSARPKNAVGIGEFWYEPEVWALPLSPTSKVLYAGLCSFLGHGQINLKDLRATLKDSSDNEIAAARDDLVRQGLLAPAPKRTTSDVLLGYEIRSVREFEV